MLRVFKASSMKRACFWHLLPNNKKSAFIELTSIKRFDSEVPSFYSRSMPPFPHKPFSLVSLSMPNTALEQEVIASAITIGLMLYLHASDIHQHSTFNRSQTVTLL